MNVAGWLFLSLAPLGLGAEPPKCDITALYQKVSLLVRHYYPDAACQMLDGRIHFEYKTRVFLVHEALKTGEWQDPIEELGPQKGGIVGDIELREGPNISQAVVPQSFDKRYFVVLLLAPSSEQLNVHLHVLIKYPPGLTGNFLQDIKDLLYHFETATKPAA
jgi:hypothetical protein